MTFDKEQHARIMAIKKDADEKLRDLISSNPNAFAPLLCPLHDDIENMVFADCDCPSDIQIPVPDVMLTDFILVTAWVDPQTMGDGSYTRSFSLAQTHSALGLLNLAVEGYLADE